MRTNLRERIAAVTLTVLVCCFCASSQAISITGTVVDSISSAGISGATVKLAEYPNVSATTASSGSFVLSGTSTILRSVGSTNLSSSRIELKNNLLTLTGIDASFPVVVDVFSCNGSRLSHVAGTAGRAGTFSAGNLWQAEGFYYIKVGANGTERVITSSGAAAKNGAPLAPNGTRLAKPFAGYTLQATKSGYLTKSMAIASTTGDAGTIRLVADQELTGVWQDVSPQGLDPRDLPSVTSSFGPGSLVGDPAHPSDMYVGGANSGLWKSTDFGRTWSKINSTVPYVPRGTTIGVAGTTPATIWAGGYNVVYKSTDGGVTFTTTNINYSLYSFAVDPYDNNHLLSGLHEADGVVESTDGGSTWQMVSGAGFPTGGISWYPFFVNTGVAATTRKTWVAIGQNGTSGGRTTDGGANWVIPTGLTGLNHQHGNASIFQKDSMLFLAGVGATSGQGVFRSTNFGVSWSRVDGGTVPEAMVWGTAKNVYVMDAWACSGCTVGPNFEIAPLPGTAWKTTSVPSALRIGPNSIAVAFDGTHYVFVGSMWDQGLWRYVEP